MEDQLSNRFSACSAVGHVAGSNDVMRSADNRSPDTNRREVGTGTYNQRCRSRKLRNSVVSNSMWLNYYCHTLVKMRASAARETLGQETFTVIVVPNQEEFQLYLIVFIICSTIHPSGAAELSAGLLSYRLLICICANMYLTQSSNALFYVEGNINYFRCTFKNAFLFFITFQSSLICLMLL